MSTLMTHLDDGPETSHGKESPAVLRPDKPFPCPRCNSLDTKFCYFNNYNVKQPRHFCRSCQRYWTVGGALRNVPVGAGRRKGKSAVASAGNAKENGAFSGSAQNLYMVCSNREQGMVSIDLGDASSSALPQPICQSYTHASIPKHQVQAPIQGRNSSSFVEKVNKASEDFYVPFMARENMHGIDGNGDLPPQKDAENSESTCSSVTTTLASSTDEHKVSSLSMTGGAVKKDTPKEAGLPDQRSSGNEIPNPVTWMWPWMWPYTLNTGVSAPVNDMSHPDPTLAAAWAAATAATAAAASFLPWPAVWNPFAWRAPWIYLGNANSSSASAAASRSLSNGSGKHPRMGTDEQEPLCVPKTQRIDCVDEAARSSILTTLGVGGPGSPLPVNGLFSAFQPKADVFQPKLTAQVSSQQLEPERQFAGPHSNTAEQARSVAFNESS